MNPSGGMNNTRSLDRGGLSWDGRTIEIIDQTKLPTSLDIIRLESVDAAIDAIRRLAIRGAPAIGACGALAVVLGLDEGKPDTLSKAKALVESLSQRIGTARPTAVNLAWAVRRVREAALHGETTAEVRQRALDEAQSIMEEDRESCRLIGEHGRTLMRGKSRILTHCNTGRLATIGWGTALGVVYAKVAAGEPVQVFACEARPLLQGARLTAWELLDADIDVTLIADGAAASLLASGRIDAVIVGADRIAKNGDTANKIGTFGLAIAARHSGIPFYVAAPSSSFDLSLDDGTEIVVEERSADEIRFFHGRQSAPAMVPVWNPAFDVTPGQLVDGFITEKGVLKPPFDALA